MTDELKEGPATKVDVPERPLDHPLQTEPGQTVGLKECGSCGGSHADVEIHSYTSRQGPYTHWYICPTTGDAVPTCLVMIGKTMGIEVVNSILNSIIEAMVRQRYLIAVWSIRPDPTDEHQDRLTLERHPVAWKDFPIDDQEIGFPRAIALLEDHLTEFHGREIRSAHHATGPAPLPRVQRGVIPTNVRLFGDEDNGEG